MSTKEELQEKHPVTTCLVYLVVFGLLSIWTDRNLDFWCTHFSTHEVDVPWWISLLVTLAGNAVIVFANLIGEIGRLCL